MKKTDYIIFGPNVNDEPQYWDNDQDQWTSDYSKATHYDKSILTSPLPEGVVAVVEVDEQAEIHNFYKAEVLPHTESPI